MKVVINTSFGGFRVSKSMLKQLCEQDCSHVQTDSFRNYYGEEESVPHFDYEDMILDHERRVVTWEEHSQLERSCPVLVKIVEEMDTQTRELLFLRVVEIPDDVNWYIENYDGLEHVAEVHRTWR